MLERYFAQPDDARLADVRKELHYQVGATPSRVELPRDHCARMQAFKDTDKPLSLCPPEKDPKWRFFFQLGERPTETEFPVLNAPPVVPAAFPEWTEVRVPFSRQSAGRGEAALGVFSGTYWAASRGALPAFLRAFAQHSARTEYAGHEFVGLKAACRRQRRGRPRGARFRASRGCHSRPHAMRAAPARADRE